MNIRLLTFVFILIGASVHAQKDLIVTQAGQMIRCKILEESSMRFTYAYVSDKGKVSKTEIFKTLISSYKYNYYPEDLLPNEKIFNQPLKTVAVKTENAEPKKAKSKTEETVSKSNALTVEKKSEKSKDSEKDKPLIAENKGQDSKAENKKQDNRKEDPTAVSKNKSTEPEEVLADKAIAKDAVAKEVKSEADSEKDEGFGDEVEQEKEKKSEFKNYLKYRVGLKGGLGNIMEENLNKTKYGLFEEKFLRGWVYGVDGAMFLNDNVGVGVTYNSYQSSNKASKLDLPFNNEQGSKTYDEVFKKVNHKFVGPTLLYRVALDFKTFIVASASPGYIFYTENLTLRELGDSYPSTFKYKGNTWGGAATLGIDFLIGDDNFGRDVILSFELGYNYGKITKLNYGGTSGVQALPNPINLQRLDFSVGLRFNRFPRYLK